uniref:Uncharacterized protein n=2 Tax=Cacopsylla melanoneura TaxID=428564 RepID=A0A8D8YJK8_9HEMI
MLKITDFSETPIQTEKKKTIDQMIIVTNFFFLAIDHSDPSQHHYTRIVHTHFVLNLLPRHVSYGRRPSLAGRLLIQLTLDAGQGFRPGTVGLAKTGVIRLVAQGRAKPALVLTPADVFHKVGMTL